MTAKHRLDEPRSGLAARFSRAVATTTPLQFAAGAGTAGPLRSAECVPVLSLEAFENDEDAWRWRLPERA